MIRRAGLVILVILFTGLAGCANTGPQKLTETCPRQPLTDWLSATDGTLAVLLAGQDQSVSWRMRVDGRDVETNRLVGTLKGMGKGALGGAAVTGQMFRSVNCSGEACGVILLALLVVVGAGTVIGATVGAVDGAMTVEPRLAVLGNVKPPVAIERSIGEAMAKSIRLKTGRDVVVIARPEDSTSDEDPGNARMVDSVLERYDSVFEVRVIGIRLDALRQGDDLAVGLYLDTEARAYQAKPPDAPKSCVNAAQSQGRWHYTGGLRNVEFWSDRDAAALRHEIDFAATDLAGDMTAAFFP